MQKRQGFAADGSSAASRPAAVEGSKEVSTGLATARGWQRGRVARAGRGWPAGSAGLDPAREDQIRRGGSVWPVSRGQQGLDPVRRSGPEGAGWPTRGWSRVTAGGCAAARALGLVARGALLRRRIWPEAGLGERDPTGARCWVNGVQANKGGPRGTAASGGNARRGHPARIWLRGPRTDQGLAWEKRRGKNGGGRGSPVEGGGPAGW